MTALLEIINIVLPVFLVIGFGYCMGITGFINASNNRTLSKLVFYGAAPALLFRSAASTPFSEAVNIKTIVLITVITIILAFVVYLFSAKASSSRRGVLTQGAHRSNMVFVGLPVIANAFGDDQLGLAVLLIGVMVITYNIIAVVALTLPHNKHGSKIGVSISKSVKGIITNPLILSCCGGIIFSAWNISVPISIDRSLDMVGKIAMPLALISVGVGLDFKKLHSEIKPTIILSIIKLLIYPGLVFTGLYIIGLRGIDLYVPVLITATPTAVVSAIMAKEMKGDEQLAAAIVIGTTSFSLITISLWLLFFRLIS